MRELVARDADGEEIRSWFREHGGRNLLSEGVRAAEAEMTSLDEVMRVAFIE